MDAVELAPGGGIMVAGELAPCGAAIVAGSGVVGIGEFAGDSEFTAG
jgi:hypothetical protein